jgi:hypothetical protein
MANEVNVHCNDCSGHKTLLDVHTVQIAEIFHQLDRIFYTSLSLLVAVIVDIVTRVYYQHPH